MRLFVAIDVPDGLREEIESKLVAPLRDTLAGARWTRPEGRHLTLAFLGDVDDGRVEEIAASLKEAARPHAAFEAAFEDIGGFPSLKRPRVLWAGIGEGADALRALAADVRGKLEPLGLYREERAFHPHLTLARFPNPRPVELPHSVDLPAKGFEVVEIVLFRSQLHPKGARYTALDRFPLLMDS